MVIQKSNILLLSTHSLDPCLWGESDHPAYPSIWRAAPPSQRGLSTNPGVTMWCVRGCSSRDDVCRVCGCYRGGIVVMDVFWRRLCISISSELLMCGGGARSIFLLPLVARCLETICIYMAHVCFLCLLWWGLWEYLLCSGRCWKKCFLASECWSMLCVCVGDVMDVVFSVCIVRRGVSCRCSYMGSVSVFRHTDVVCLCLVCILWQLSMLRSAWLAVC